LPQTVKKSSPWRAEDKPSRNNGQRIEPPRGNANDFLAAALGGEIIAGVYRQGERLPCEATLLERFRVSRPTLREAFRALAAKGLIVSRQKIGTSVRPKSEWNMLDPDFLAWHLRTAPTEDFVNDLFQLRRIVEPQAAALAARLGDAPAIARIGAAFDDMASADRDGATIASADLRFHRAILEATGNHFVAALGGLIETALSVTFERRWRSAIVDAERIEQHRRVLEAIADGLPDAARARMEELLQASVQDVGHEIGRAAKACAANGGRRRQR